MTAAPLRADCARCAALCCVALGFERSTLFAFDKACGEACRHLGPGGRCGIHESREREGFAGCVGYDCLGAGQRVTQELFGGRSWQDDPALRAPMVRAFGIMLRLHGLLALLREARKLPLSPAERRTLAGLEAALDPPQGWSPEGLAAAPLAEVGQRCATFLRSLEHLVPAH